MFSAPSHIKDERRITTRFRFHFRYAIEQEPEDMTGCVGGRCTNWKTITSFIIAPYVVWSREGWLSQNPSLSSRGLKWIQRWYSMKLDLNIVPFHNVLRYNKWTYVYLEFTFSYLKSSHSIYVRLTSLIFCYFRSLLPCIYISYQIVDYIKLV